MPALKQAASRVSYGWSLERERAIGLRLITVAAGVCVESGISGTRSIREHQELLTRNLNLTRSEMGVSAVPNYREPGPTGYPGYLRDIRDIRDHSGWIRIRDGGISLLLLNSIRFSPCRTTSTFTALEHSAGPC